MMMHFYETSLIENIVVAEMKLRLVGCNERFDGYGYE